MGNLSCITCNTWKMVSLRLTVCAFVLFLIGIEAAPNPDPFWYPPYSSYNRGMNRAPCSCGCNDAACRNYAGFTCNMETGELSLGMNRTPCYSKPEKVIICPQVEDSEF